MSEVFKNNEFGFDELLNRYQQISKDYQKETQENAELKRDIKQYRIENERLEKLFRELKKLHK